MVVRINTSCFTSSAFPFKDQTPLFVNTDGMQAFEVSPQFLEMIAGRHAKILILRGIVKHLHSPEQGALEARWNSL